MCFEASITNDLHRLFATERREHKNSFLIFCNKYLHIIYHSKEALYIIKGYSWGIKVYNFWCLTGWLMLVAKWRTSCRINYHTKYPTTRLWVIWKRKKKRSTNVANRQEVRQDTGLHILQVGFIGFKVWSNGFHRCSSFWYQVLYFPICCNYDYLRRLPYYKCLMLVVCCGWRTGQQH